MIEKKIIKRIKYLQKLRDQNIGIQSRNKYNFAIAELQFVLQLMEETK